MARAFNNPGFATFKTGKKEQGPDLINHSLTLDKGNSYAYKNLGIIYMKSGERAKAKEYLQLALKYKYTEMHDDEVLKLIQIVS